MMMGIAILAAAMIMVKPAAARGAPESFADLVEKLSPAVVNISTVQTIRESRVARVPALPEGLPFGDLWDQFRNRDDEDPEPRQARSLGSGFIVDASGIVITNNHVVEEADEITVITTDGTEYAAKVLGKDQLSDVAVLKIEPKNGEKLPFVVWGDSDKERIGDWVVAIGNPFGLGGSVTAGIVSARNRAIGGNSDIEFIQTDAPINRGNSGGPLFNMKGEVIGVNSAIFSPSGGNVGIGFSIPSNDADRVMRELQQFGKVRRGWLGVGIQPMTEEIAESLGMEYHKGAMVTNVQEGSPAEKAGLKQSDIIVTWDGKEVEDSTSLSRLVKRTDIGKPVVVEIVRAGKRQKINVTTGELKEEKLAEAEGDNNQGRGGPDGGYADREMVQGLELAPMTDNLRRRYNLDEDVDGVVVSRVARRSPAYQAGIRPGTVILAVNQQEVSQPADVADLVGQALDEKRERILLLISYRGNTVHVPLKVMTEEEEEALRRR
ncbi:MAG: DegQ family serine endoprotease [Alphaproteobacteria bacterium]|nr:MAG: DegQ family serine endoprotease [Alphaproteobacteria bacterium]